MAVGVASTRAQGQKTTRMVTARMISPVISQVRTAAVRAMTTTQVAHRLYQPDHSLNGAVFPYLYGLHFKGSELIYRSTGNIVPRSFIHGKRFPGHDSLVY